MELSLSGISYRAIFDFGCRYTKFLGLGMSKYKSIKSQCSSRNLFNHKIITRDGNVKK